MLNYWAKPIPAPVCAESPLEHEVIGNGWPLFQIRRKKSRSQKSANAESHVGAGRQGVTATLELTDVVREKTLE